MAKSTAMRTQRSNKKYNAKNQSKTHSAAFVAGFSGAALGIALMLAVAVPMMRQQLQAATDSLGSRVVAMSPASADLSCLDTTTNSSAVNSAKDNTKTADTNLPMVNGRGAGPGGGANVIMRTIGSYRTQNSGTINNTGANSNNVFRAVTNNSTAVNNSNTINLVNNNSQSTSSGNVISSRNTSAGGAESGQATNTSDSSYSIAINN